MLFGDLLLLFEKYRGFCLFVCFSEESQSNFEPCIPEQQAISVITGNTKGYPCLPNRSAITVHNGTFLEGSIDSLIFILESREL